MILVKPLCFAIFLTSTYNIALTQPPGKHWEGIAHNQNTNELAVFSGAEFKDNKMFVTDSLWLFNNRWRLVDGNNIPGRWAHGMVYHDNSLYTYGGWRLNAEQQEEILNDLHRFNGSWSKVAEGPKLSLPSLHSLKGKLYLAGQSLLDTKNFEVWELMGDTFEKQTSAKLDAETDWLRTLIVQNCFVVIYPSDSGFAFQNVTTGLTSVVKDLPIRTKFGITYNAHLDSYFFFGGLDERRNFSNVLWRIKNGRSEKLISQDSPSPRSSCTLVPTAKGFILYGGTEDNGKPTNSMWYYENGQWIRVEY